MFLEQKYSVSILTDFQKTSELGKEHKPFWLTFQDDYFEFTDCVGAHEDYIVSIRSDAEKVENGYRYIVELMTGDRDKFVPEEFFTLGTKWHKEWSIVEQTLAKRS